MEQKNIDEKHKLTVAIPTYNSSKYLSKCIKSVVNLNCVDEILISDDGSCISEVEKINIIAKNFKKKSNKNIKVLNNVENKGAFENKLKSIRLSKNKHVYVLDSDNIASKNLDKIYKKYLRDDNTKDFLVQPNIMYQFWSKHKLSKFMSQFDKKYIVKFSEKDIEIDFNLAKNSLINNSGSYILNELVPESLLVTNPSYPSDFIKDKWIFWILNCGNFIVNRDEMVKVAEEGLLLNRRLRSVDAVVFSYLWLMNSKKIKIYKDFYHHHRKRNDSVSFKEMDDSKYSIKYFIKQILNN